MKKVGIWKLIQFIMFLNLIAPHLIWIEPQLGRASTRNTLDFVLKWVNFDYYVLLPSPWITPHFLKKSQIRCV